MWVGEQSGGMTDRELAETAADGLSVLANPLRLRILLALSETRQPDWEQRGMSYSDLRAAVGVEDGGRFNYHLDELRGRFVGNEDGHYWLSAAGWRIVDELYAGTFSGSHERREGELSYTCDADDEPLTATVEHGLIEVTCPTHGTVFDMTLPFSLLDDSDRDLDDLYEYAFRQAQQYVESVCSDVCPHCGGRFDGPDVEHAEVKQREYLLVGFRCRRCAVAFRLPIEQIVVFRPPVVGFFDDYGIDATSPALYDRSGEWTMDVHEHEDGFVVAFECGGERLTLDLDRSLATRSPSREPIDDGDEAKLTEERNG